MRPLRSALFVVALVLLVPTAASAANRQIGISNYQWSDSEIKIDRGEHVTWNWLGPDTMHSVTGEPPKAAGLDSDPRTSQPIHKIGDQFRLDFDEPGEYTFQCKLHSTVRGTVEVSNVPGDPDSEPDPVPKSQVDLDPPHFRDVRIGKRAFRANGTSLRYALNETARVDIEYFRVRKRAGKRFAGYARHRAGHIGNNGLRFGVERRHFRPREGRYLAKVTATDRAANTTRPVKFRFRVLKNRFNRR